MYVYLDGISWRGGAFYLKKLRSSSIVAHTEQRRIALWAPLIQGGGGLVCIVLLNNFTVMPVKPGFHVVVKYTQ